MMYDFSIFTANVIRKNQKELVIEGYIKNWNPDMTISYLAAKNPDYNQSFTGSALPFPDAEIAFDRTPNNGHFKPSSREFQIHLQFPNSYYSHLGTRFIPPHVRINIQSGNVKLCSEILEVGEVAPFRLLSYQSTPMPRTSPLFYNRSHMTELPQIRTQEQILRDSEYSLTTPLNFWGGAIPHS
jgi:hypothetical protein